MDRTVNGTVTTHILGFNDIDNDRYHNTFHLQEDSTAIVLTGDTKIHMIELQKHREVAVAQQRKLVRWTLFLLGPGREKMEALAMVEPAIQKALTTLEFLNQDQGARERYEARQKAIHGWNLNMQEAQEKGRQEGESSKAIEVDRKIVEGGVGDEIIHRLTGVALEALQQLRKERPH